MQPTQVLAPAKEIPARVRPKERRNKQEGLRRAFYTDFIGLERIEYQVSRFDFHSLLSIHFQNAADDEASTKKGGPGARAELARAKRSECVEASDCESGACLTVDPQAEQIVSSLPEP
jgi:hypothetical protein